VRRCQDGLPRTCARVPEPQSGPRRTGLRPKFGWELSKLGEPGYPVTRPDCDTERRDFDSLLEYAESPDAGAKARLLDRNYGFVGSAQTPLPDYVEDDHSNSLKIPLMVLAHKPQSITACFAVRPPTRKKHSPA